MRLGRKHSDLTTTMTITIKETAKEIPTGGKDNIERSRKFNRQRFESLGIVHADEMDASGGSGGNGGCGGCGGSFYWA